MRQTLFVLAIVPGLLLADAKSRLDPTVAAPPMAPKRPQSTSLHGVTWVDDYYWIKEKTDPATIKYLEAENAYTDAVAAPIKPLQDQLYKEILGRIKQTDLSVPYQHRGWWYYSRQIEGKQYSVRCRKKGSLEAAEVVLLDGNELGAGKKFMSIGASVVSDDGNTLVYGVDFTGFREYHLFAKDLRTGKLLSDQPIVKASQAVFAKDNKTIFYVTEDAAKRAHKLWRHVLGSDQHELVYEEKDELFRLGVNRSRDDWRIFAHSHSSNESEWRSIRADQPKAEFRVILPRQKDHNYDVEYSDQHFYIRTNLNAKNYKIMFTGVENPSIEKWHEYVAHRDNVFIDRLHVFQGYCVLSEREAGVPYLNVVLGNDERHRIEMPEPVYSVSMAENPDYQASAIRFSYTSLVTPASVFEYDVYGRQRKLLKQTEVLGGYDASKYKSERIHATAADGTQVPISIVYRADRPRDGSGALYLTGYGAYGASAGVYFNSANLSLLDRGAAVATAHIRGGKDLGQHWHDQGKMFHKKNSFTDFIACADHLVTEKYCARDRLVIQGGSAGGLLIGATVNIRPDVCKAAILDVPFVDVITTMLDESLPLTVGEFLEWGNPKLKDQFEYMRSYCPYSNLRPGPYPAMLLTTSLNDSQVGFHEPTKYIARLRTLKTDPAPLLLKCNMAGGHGGSSGRYDVLREQAFRFAFALDQMGLGL